MSAPVRVATLAVLDDAPAGAKYAPDGKGPVRVKDADGSWWVLDADGRRVGEEGSPAGTLRLPGALVLPDAAPPPPACNVDVHQVWADVLGNLWLYVDWRHMTRQLTTPQREAWADVVDAWTPDGAARDDEFRVDRWWRDPETATHVHDDDELAHLPEYAQVRSGCGYPYTYLGDGQLLPPSGEPIVARLMPDCCWPLRVVARA